MSGLTFGSLFAGIGGMDLGLERAGMRCAWRRPVERRVPRHPELRALYEEARREDVAELKARLLARRKRAEAWVGADLFAEVV